MKLSVLQWNIWYQEDIKNITRVLKEINADVMCLQELTTNHPGQSHSDTIGYIAEQLGFNVYATEPMGRDDIERKQFNAIFSKYPMSDQIQIWINTPVGTGGPSDEYRAYIETSLLIGGSKVRVATTHMSYIDRFEMTDRKKQETDQLITNIDGKKNLILAGDFNASPNSYTIQQIGKYLKNTGPDYNQKTWTTKPFKHNDFEEDKLVWRLDYIFATEDLVVESSEIINTQYSDHLPILSQFRLGDIEE